MGRRRKRRPRGFSDRSTKATFDAFSELSGIHGPAKRRVLNGFAMWIAASAALSTGFTGCMIVWENGHGIIWGWIAAFFIATFVFNAVMRWMAKDRYFRP